MMNISGMEMVVIAIIALIVLGPARLPTMAKQVGKGMREFRSAMSGNFAADDDDDDEPEPKRATVAAGDPAP